MTKILILEDHKLIVEGFKLALSEGYDKFEIDVANNCNDCLKLLNSTAYDLYVIDINVPAGNTSENLSGRSVLEKVRKLNKKNCKIVICTSHSEYLTIYSLFKEFSPDGFVLKCDITPQDFKSCINSVLDNKSYYSNTVLEAIDKVIAESKYLDAINRSILALMDKGVRTKNMANYVNLSQSAIDKRKLAIREFFGLYKGNDEDILTIARLKKFI